jgi:hypothetical protein
MGYCSAMFVSMTGSGEGSLSKRSVLFIGILALLNYWPVLFGKVPLPSHLVTQFPPWESVRGPFHRPAHAEMGDLVTELYPWKAFTHRAVAGGTLPLWNPHLLLGAPFLGDPQTGLFYPPNLVYFFLPTPLAWSFSFLLRTVFAGVLAALLTRTLGATQTAALTAGVIFAFCGWITAFQARPHLDTSLWLPLVLLAVDRLQRRPEGPSVAWVGLAFALPVLAGQPENAAHVTLVGLIFFVYRAALPPPPRDGASTGRLRFIALFGAAGLLALGLAAVQTLPTLEWIGQLERSLHMFWGPKPLHEIGAFLSRDLGSHPNSANVSIPESAAYAGMLTLLVAPLAFLHPNRRDAIFFAALVASVLQIVYGRGPVYWLSQHTPILESIPNGRLLVVADLGLAVLAGLGLSALGQELGTARPLRPSLWLSPAAALACGGAGIALIMVRAKAESHPSGFLSLQTLRQPMSSALALLAAAGLLGWALARRVSPRRFAALALGFTALDLVTASYGFIPFTTPAEIFPSAPTFQFLKKEPELHRVASVDATWGSSFEMMYGLESATGFTVPLRRATKLLSTLGPKSDSPSFEAGRIIRSHNRLLDLMNVKYLAANTWNRSAEMLASRPDRFRLVFSDETVRVFQNLSVLPRAFLVPASHIAILPDENSQFDHLCAPSFDPAESVILPESPPAEPEASGRERPTVSEVTRVEQGINHVSLRVKAAEPSVLVLSQMAYPGWKTLIDGKETPVLRVDYAFLGTIVGPGTHYVRFLFRPQTLRIGASVSAAALLICLVLWGMRRPAPTAALRTQRQTSTPDRPES